MLSAENQQAGQGGRGAGRGATLGRLGSPILARTPYAHSEYPGLKTGIIVQYYEILSLNTESEY